MDYNKELKKLNDKRIWVTKKIRMISAEKMRKKNLKFNFFLIYYSAILAVMTILNLYAPSGFKINIFASVISFVLPSVNIFLYKVNYSKKEEEFTNCYLELEELYDNINTELAKKNTLDLQSLEKYHKDYNDIMKKYINHESDDYKTFCLKDIRYRNRLSAEDIISMRSKMVFLFFVDSVLLIAPLYLIFLKLFSLNLY